MPPGYAVRAIIRHRQERRFILYETVFVELTALPLVAQVRIEAGNDQAVDCK